MLLDPIPNNCTLTIIDVETNAEARTDGAAHDGGYVDDSSIGKREGDVDGLTYREWPGGSDLHTPHRKVTALGRYAVCPIVAADSDWNFKRNSRRTPGFAAELKLSFCRSPFWWGRSSAQDCKQEKASHNSGRN